MGFYVHLPKVGCELHSIFCYCFFGVRMSQKINITLNIFNYSLTCRKQANILGIQAVINMELNLHNKIYNHFIHSLAECINLNNK
jgi:hypothetical protein